MSAQWFMSTVVCDDIRKEEGNKLSYMGIYGTSIIIPSFPFTLPKLCFIMTLMESEVQSPPTSVTFRVFRDDEVFAEVSLPREALAETSARAQAQPGSRDSRRLTLGTVLQVFPLQLTEPCVFKARAICDDKEIKGGSWPVESLGQQV